jgi:nucleoside-diphosphate-sugar epimerase
VWDWEAVRAWECLTLNALVTGAGGFLGLFIVERLVARGDSVRALCRRRSAALDGLCVETIVGDVRDAEAVSRACRGVDVVFHAAGVAGIWGPWSHYYSINTQGTRNVVAACRAGGASRLVYTSSPSVTFDGKDQRGVDESTPYPRRWLAGYPKSKALAEQQVLAANSAELATCALRPHLMWGPRDRQLVPRLWGRARAGKLRRVGDGTNLIDTLYVENAADAHLQAADALGNSSPVAGNAYFLSQGEPVNCWKWIDELLAIAGLPPVEKSISVGWAWRVGAAAEAAYRLLGLRGEPALTRFLAAQLGRSHYFDVGRARRDFGFAPRVSVAEGMQRLRQWYEAQRGDSASPAAAAARAPAPTRA